MKGRQRLVKFSRRDIQLSSRGQVIWERCKLPYRGPRPPEDFAAFLVVAIEWLYNLPLCSPVGYICLSVCTVCMDVCFSCDNMTVAVYRSEVCAPERNKSASMFAVLTMLLFQAVISWRLLTHFNADWLNGLLPRRLIKISFIVFMWFWDPLR